MRFVDLKNGLDSYFFDTSDHTLNTQYLEDCVRLTLDNTRELYDDIHLNKRRKIHSIVWQGFIELSQDCCRNIHYPLLGQSKSAYSPTSQQLKKYLIAYGYTPETIFGDLIAHYEKSRAIYPESLQ